jgi:CheY-like chemotaxis protein
MLQSSHNLQPTSKARILIIDDDKSFREALAESIRDFGHDVALIMSLVIDHYGLLRVQEHPCSLLRILRALLMIGGVTLISKF